MIIFKKADALSHYLKTQQNKGKTIGFVPTMGALHRGHISLVEGSRTQNDVTVCSIFVNPTQFNNPDDFAKYPNTITTDVALLTREGASILFLPSREEIYPAGHIKKNYDLGILEQVLEGAFRPGHFQGVCEVMERLLAIVHPDHLYLGQKDYQQCMVIARLVALLQLDLRLSFMPTLREPDGLAMSSRNLRLGAEERRRAVFISETLSWIKNNFRNMENEALEREANSRLAKQGLQADYVVIADAGTLQPLPGKQQPAIALAAATVGQVRLIDNLFLN
jgi:pantoate--beta-alanine ligase